MRPWVKIVLILLGFVSVGIFILNFRLSQLPIPKIPGVSVTLTTNPTLNWKTYTNQKYRYEIKYPPEWKTYDVWKSDWYPEQQSKREVIGFLSPDYKLLYHTGKTDSDVMGIEIFITTEVIEGVSSLDALKAKRPKSWGTIDHQNLLWLKGSLHKQPRFETVKNGKVYELYLEAFEPSQQDLAFQTLEQMFSTFRFLE